MKKDWINKNEWDALNAFQKKRHKIFCKKYKKQIKRYFMIDNIDNFDLIKPLLEFPDEDSFYFVQIIQRKKDGNNITGTNNTNRTIRTYRITSQEKLMKLKDEMIGLANYFNARVGINLNKRSFEKTAFNTLRKMAEQMHNKDYRNVRSAYDSACGLHNSSTDKLWILDIDDIGRKANDFILYAERECHPEGNLFVTTLPTKNGYHIIMRPFNTQKFSEKFPDIDIHKNNPTNLYIP